MRIGIDARFFGPKEKGLGVYVQKLVENLEKTSGSENHQFFIFLKKERFDDFQPKNKNFNKIIADFNWYGWKEQFLYPFFLNKYNLELMHFGHFNVPLLYRRKIVVTIHDLILFHYPTVKNTTLNKFHYLIKYLAYRFAIKSAARRAVKVIAISKFTRKDLIKTLKVPKNKIKVIYQGCNFLSQNSSKKPETILKKYAIVKPYLLYVGNAYPHKNLERLTRVFARFNQVKPQTKLVLAGGRDYFYQQLEQTVKKEKFKNIIFPGFIASDDLVTIYQEAEMVVFPSLYEGFGFPPLEAIAQGRKVACSDRTSMPEILGGSVNYFDPENEDEMTKCLKETFEKENKQKKHGKIASKFSWEKTAKDTLKIYDSVAKTKK